MRGIIFLSFIVILSACTTSKSAIKADKNAPLTIAEGYLLLGVDTKYDLHAVEINGGYMKRIVLTSEDIQSGSNYILIILPMGEYSIDKIRVAELYYYKLKPGYWNFKIEPGRVNYIGNLKVNQKAFLAKQAYFELMNEASVALEYMQEAFPLILRTRQIRYAGPGTDAFFEYVRLK